MSLFDSASLVVTPNGYKEDKLYSIKPTDGSGDLVVTRATTATRVNSAGLIEQVPYNLVTYSNDFTNAAWSKNNATVTANSIISPDGTQNASLISSTSTTESGIFQIIDVSGTNTWSFYAKKGTGRYVFLNTNVPLIAAKFDLESGVVVGTPSLGATASIENVGNGWYRCILSSSTSVNRFTIFITNNTTTTDVTSSVGLNFYLYGAQLAQGTSAKEYFPTTDRLNVPRIDYTNGSCPSILVEPQRTNIKPYSEQFDNADWTKTNVNITANSTISPSGVQNADAIIENTTADAYHRILPAYPFSGVANTNYTFSVYVKKIANQPTRHIYWMCQLGADAIFAHFNMTNYSVNQVSSSGSGSNASASIINVGNDWYRITLSGIISNASGDYYNQFYTEDSVSTGFSPNPYTGNGTSGFYLWGWQIEQGAYPTSYIPTVASTVTRNADVISKTGISSLIGQTEGTVFIDVDVNLSYTQTDMRFINVSDGTSANWYFIGTNNANEFRFYYRAGATTYVSITTALTSGRHKLAFAYKSNDYVAYLDGTQVNNTTTLAVGSTSQIELGNSFGSDIGKEYTNASALWKTRLTNTELASLTTI